MLHRKALMLAAASLAIGLAAPTARAQTPAPNPIWQRAILETLSPETRAEIERRATGGNSVYEVLRTMLLNNMQLANVISAGEPPLQEVVAIDFIRGTAVFRQLNGIFRVIPFDTRTLQLQR